MKKSLTLILCLCMLFCALPGGVAEAGNNVIIIGENDKPTYTSGGAASSRSFDITDDGVISMNSEASIPATMKIPATVGGKDVKTIGGNFFGPRNAPKVVQISEGIEAIGVKAFRAESTLCDIILPSTLISIGDEAFYNCSNLKEIDIPESVSSIGASAFHGCISIGEVILPEGLSSVSSQCFAGCESLECMYIPASVRSIGKNAFYGCDNLFTVNFGGTTEQWRSIGTKAYLPKGCRVVCEYKGRDAAFDSRQTVPVYKVEASSYLDQGWIKHYPENLVDGNIDNVWCEGVKGDGEEESVTFFFDGEVSISGIVINGGYQKRFELYEGNNRPSELLLEMSNGAGGTIYLDDLCQAQTFDFTNPIKVQWVKMIIKDVYSGSCQDTVISEVRFLG